MFMGTKELGDLGEKIACEYLVKKGYKILGKNYRISFGEIDIIAKKRLAPLNKISQILSPPRAGLFNWVKRLFDKNDETIHFIEVKTAIGSNNGFSPEERVNYKKQIKLRQLAEIWMGKRGFLKDYPYQIDVMGISISPDSNKEKINYLENVVEDL